MTSYTTVGTLPLDALSANTDYAIVATSDGGKVSLSANKIGDPDWNYAPITNFRNALGIASGAVEHGEMLCKAAGIVPTQPIEEFAADLIAAARKKGYGADVKVEEMLRARIMTETANAGDAAWKQHQAIVREVREAARDKFVAAFLAEVSYARGRGGLPIWHLARQTVDALVDALRDAGYTEHGRGATEARARP